MIANERERLVAPCGIDCGICSLHVAAQRPELLEALVARGIAREKLPCEGCRNIEGSCPVIAKPCATYACVSAHRVEFCHECAEFPCALLQPASDRADVLPHNLKVFNLCVVRREGPAGLVRVSADIEKRYFKGKMLIGSGPQLPAP